MLFDVVSTILGHKKVVIPKVKEKTPDSNYYGISREMLIEVCRLYKGKKKSIMLHLGLSKFKLNRLLKRYEIDVGIFKDY